jgi:Rps23 Pro-64 3,4-dihydroxylase Tpa1-like proline 4-hydroxylase
MFLIYLLLEEQEEVTVPISLVQGAVEQEDCLQELFQVHQVLTLSQLEVVAVELEVQQEVVMEATHLFQV